MGFLQFTKTITEERVAHSYVVSIVCLLITTFISRIFGVVMAWILIRHKFSFKMVLDGFIDLPVVLPMVVQTLP